MDTILNYIAIATWVVYLAVGVANPAKADNKILINQAGDNLNLSVTLKGYGNKIRNLENANGKATLSGATNTVSIHQQGNNNDLGMYNSGNNQITDAYVVGNNNGVFVDNHGHYGKLDVDVIGNSNYAWLEAGHNNQNTDNEIQLWQAGNDHYAYLEAFSGNNNIIDAYQGNGQDDNYIRAIMGSGSDNNNLKIWQGKHLTGTTDSDETGGHEAYWTVYGDNNNLASSQTDTNRAGGGTNAGPHHLANIITGNSNDVDHRQLGKSGHDGFIEITGDNNDVVLYQRGNGGVKWADIVLDGDGHSVDVNQRGGNNATATIDLTYGTGAYTLDLSQNVGTSAVTYSITGVCYTPAGCSITVNQDN